MLWTGIMIKTYNFQVRKKKEVRELLFIDFTKNYLNLQKYILYIKLNI